MLIGLYFGQFRVWFSFFFGEFAPAFPHQCHDFADGGALVTLLELGTFVALIKQIRGTRFLGGFGEITVAVGIVRVGVFGIIRTIFFYFFQNNLDFAGYIGSLFHFLVRLTIAVILLNFTIFFLDYFGIIYLGIFHFSLEWNFRTFHSLLCDFYDFSFFLAFIAHSIFVYKFMSKLKCGLLLLRRLGLRLRLCLRLCLRFCLLFLLPR
mmetsp:Transcript_22278/g.51028  ORF Transcript_22278/g.51028 Transcript_22278/m.51028 type:complete len:208 (-) Transcript_22278:780-1403(-)